MVCTPGGGRLRLGARRLGSYVDTRSLHVTLGTQIGCVEMNVGSWNLEFAAEPHGKHVVASAGRGQMAARPCVQHPSPQSIHGRGCSRRPAPIQPPHLPRRGTVVGRLNRLWLCFFSVRSSPNHLPIPDSHPLFPWPASFRDSICVALMRKIATVEFWAQEGPVRPVSVVYKGSYFLTLLPGVLVAGPWLRP